MSRTGETPARPEIDAQTGAERTVRNILRTPNMLRGAAVEGYPRTIEHGTNGDATITTEYVITRASGLVRVLIVHQEKHGNGAVVTRGVTSCKPEPDYNPRYQRMMDGAPGSRTDIMVSIADPATGFDVIPDGYDYADPIHVAAGSGKDPKQALALVADCLAAASQQHALQVQAS